MPEFSLEGEEEKVWRCAAFDPPWNGWASPVVDWEVLIDLLREVGWHFRTTGSVFHVGPAPDAEPNEHVVLAPDDHGYYHLRALGWTFLEADPWATILTFPSRAQS